MDKSIPPQESERRVATILFADISGFTAMSEQLDAEEVTAIMNDCFKMMGAVIEANGGHVDKFIGDCVMALFGVPTAIEDAPCKAINTAIELKNRIYRFNEEKKLKIPLDIHIGINTGEVVAGSIGSQRKQDYTVMGDAVNLASRLEHISTAGQVIVGPLTYRYLREEFEFKILKPITVKGKKEPIPVFELLSKKERQNRQIDNCQLHSSLVDREKELSQLELAIIQVINGRGGIFNITGEAGIGKTRLLREAKLNRFIKRVTLIEARALSIGKNLSFHPAIDIFKKLASVKEGDDKATTLFKLNNFVRTVMQDKTSEVFPFIALMMGIKPEAEQTRLFEDVEGSALAKLLVKSIKEFIIESSKLKPIIIVLEDLHWADESSIELLTSLFKLIKKTPVLFINIFRPGYGEGPDKVINAAAEYSKQSHTLKLQALEKSDSEKLTKKLLKDIKSVPDKVTRKIARRSGGNPFFIEEVIRSLIDNQFIVIEKGHTLINDNIVSAVIPNSINEVIMSRIDRLDNPTKQLLKVASVIGQSFFSRILCYMVKNKSEIDNSMDYLERVQLITERVRMGEVEYIFKHAIARETIYNSILQQTRKELHLQVATTIESQFEKEKDELYGMLAYHYSRAGELDKTEEYLELAGKAALDSSASSEALNYYQQALELYKKKLGNSCDSAYMAKLEKSIAMAYQYKGCYSEAATHYSHSLKYLGQKLPKNRLIMAFNILWGLGLLLKHLYLPNISRPLIPPNNTLDVMDILSRRCWITAYTDPAISCYEAVTATSYLLKYDIKKVKNGISYLAEISFACAGFGISLTIAKKLLNYLNNIGPLTNKKDYYSRKFAQFTIAYLSGEWNVNYDETLTEYFIHQGNYSAVNIYLSFFLTIYNEKGEFEKGALLIKQLKKFGKEYDNYSLIVTHFEHIYLRKLKQKRPAEEFSKLEKLSRLIKKTGEKALDKNYLGIKALQEIMTNDYLNARESLYKVETILKKEKIKLPIQTYSYQTACFLLHLKLLEKYLNKNNRKLVKKHRKAALKAGRKAVKGTKLYAASRPENFRLMGSYYWLVGRKKKAFYWWNRSVEQSERLGARIELARTYMEIGKRLLEGKGKIRSFNSKNSEQCLALAEETFHKLGLSCDLEELEEIRGRLKNGDD